MCSGIAKIRLGDVICYEVGFDGLVRSEVTGGANLLAVQSNDADFELDGQLGESEQQVAMARIRAIESDRAVVYASTTGESAIISPDGSLIARSGTWRRAELDARVPLRTTLTLADRLGGWPEGAISAATAAALAWALASLVLAGRRPGPAGSARAAGHAPRLGGVRRPSANRQPSQYASTRGRRRPRSPISRTSGTVPAGTRNHSSSPAAGTRMKPDKPGGGSVAACM